MLQTAHLGLVLLLALNSSKWLRYTNPKAVGTPVSKSREVIGAPVRVTRICVAALFPLSSEKKKKNSLGV